MRIAKPSIWAVVIPLLLVGCSEQPSSPVMPIDETGTSLSKPGSASGSKAPTVEFIGDWNYVGGLHWQNIRRTMNDYDAHFIVYTRPNGTDWLARAAKVCELKHVNQQFGDWVAGLDGPRPLWVDFNLIVAKVCELTHQSRQYCINKMYSIPIGAELMADKDYAEAAGFPYLLDGFRLCKDNNCLLVAADTDYSALLEALK